jgi:major membrane immunogen (membrane-anchored lipoprotein)
MKKLIVFMSVMIVLLSACSDSEKTAGEKEEVTEKKTEESEAVEVDKGLLNVEVTLPASMFEGEDADSSIAEAEKEGIKVTRNDDGSVTYKMSKAKHKEMMKEMQTELEKTIADTKNGEDYPSVKEVTNNKDFSEFTLEVDREAYENSFDGFAVFGLGLSGMFYQLFNGVDPEDYEVKILVKDSATGEVFNEVIYPDAMEEAGDES